MSQLSARIMALKTALDESMRQYDRLDGARLILEKLQAVEDTDG